MALPLAVASSLAGLAVLVASCSSSSSSGAGATAGTVGVAGNAGDAGNGGSAGSGGEAGQLGTPLLAALSVSTGALRPAFDSSVTDYELTSLNSLYPIDVTATTTSPLASLTVHGGAASSGTPVTFTLAPGEDIPVTVQLGADTLTYTVHYTPHDLPLLTASASGAPGAEDVLLSTLDLNQANPTYLMMIDRSARTLYYRTFPEQVVENFQQFSLPGGRVGYACTVGVFNSLGFTSGVDHVMDQQFNDVADVQLLATAKHGVLPVEGHDFLLLDSGHYVAMAYLERTVDLSALNSAWSAQAQVMNAIVQEVKDGAVVFEWDSADVPGLYLDSNDGNQFASPSLNDYLHMNSLDIDPNDGNFVFSFRHTDSIIKVDRTSAQVMWTLGGSEDMFGLSPEQRFFHQHHVKLHADGSLTVFDNGNNQHQTRALSFSLDQMAHTVKAFSPLYTRPASEPASVFMGSVVPLASNRSFIGWGGWFSGQAAPSATELRDGSVVWSLAFADPSSFSYRALPALVAP